MKEFKSCLKTVTDGNSWWCPYTTRLDTYGCGCAHDCSYCYAKSLLSFRGLWRPDDPSVASLKTIEKAIKKIPEGKIVRLGGMTDCLQPAEAKHKVTYETIKMLNAAGIGYMIVTKSHLIATPEYLDVLDPDLAHIQISVTNTDDEAARRYERCALTSKRFAALKTLEERGIDVSLRLSPYISEFLDLDVLAKVAPQKIVAEFLRVNHWIEKWLTGLLDLSEYTLKSGGYRHLPLDKKIEKMSALKAALPGTRISVGEDVPEHYPYWRDNFNPEPGDCCDLRRMNADELQDGHCGGGCDGRVAGGGVPVRWAR